MMPSHSADRHQIHSANDPNIRTTISSPRCAGRDKKVRWRAYQPGWHEQFNSHAAVERRRAGPVSKWFCMLMHLDLICQVLCLNISPLSQTVLLNQLAAEREEWSPLQREGIKLTLLGETLLPGYNCPGSGHLHPLVRQQLLCSLCRNPSSFWTAAIADLIIDDDGQRRSSSRKLTGTTCHKS